MAISHSVLKLFATLVVLLNWKSIPFMWHVRLCVPLVAFRIRRWLHKLKLDDGKGLLPVGQDIFKRKKVFSFFADCGDLDGYGMHMSNASYLTTLDMVRGRFVLETANYPILNHGVFPALAGHKISYAKEIKPFSRFFVEASVEAFDKKWIYVANRFYTKYPSSDSSKPRTLHCLAIHRVCFKLGRRTVIPARAFASTGFGPKTGRSNHSFVQGSKVSKSAWRKWLVGEDAPEVKIDMSEVEGFQNSESNVKALEEIEAGFVTVVANGKVNGIAEAVAPASGATAPPQAVVGKENGSAPSASA